MGITIAEAAALLQAGPESPMTHGVLGQLLYQAGEFQEAIPSLKRSADLFDRILQQGPKSVSPEPEPRFEIDHMLYSEAMFRNIVRSVLAILGDCYLRVDQPKEAKEWFRKAVETWDNDADTWARYSRALATANELAEALQPCRTALALDPSKRLVWKLLSDLYRVIGRPETEYIEWVFEENRTIQQDMMVLADLCISSADYKNARRTLTRLLESNPEDKAALERLGHMHLLSREYSSAIEVLEPLSKHEPRDVEIGLLLARAYLFVGRRKDAEETLAWVVSAALDNVANEPIDISLLMRGGVSQARKVLRSSEEFLKLVIEIGRSPTQRFALLTYERGEESVRTYAGIADRGVVEMTARTEVSGAPPTDVHWYYPDIDVPTGTTLEDFLHWSRTGFHDVFPKDGAVFTVGVLSSSQGTNLVICDDRTGPFEVARYEPSALDYVWTAREHPGSSLTEPIVTGDTISLHPARPETFDHTAVFHLSAGMREQLGQIGALGMAAEEAERCVKIRERVISEQASRKRIVSTQTVESGEETETHVGRLSLANSYMKQGRYSECEKLLLAAVKPHDANPSVLSLLSKVLIIERKYDEAFPLAETALSLDKNNAELWASVGYLREHKGRDFYVAAEEAYRRALEVSKNSVNAMAYVAFFCLNRGRLEEASSWIDRILEKEPESPEGAAAKIYYLCLTESYSEGEKLARELIDRNPLSVDPWLSFSNVLLAMHSWDEALKAAEEALSRDRDSPYAWANKGEAYLGQGKLTDAESALRRAIDMDHTEGDFWYLLSLTLEQLGKTDESRQAMSNAWKYGARKAVEIS
ncbi:MAG: hypothetical protein C4K49_05840 [Candidatus Thorarchaeota archaeon]|nr:MAG: hypothetical protein C4K49_05840 [Candidatus Thorarchaeota archaeon]